MLSNIGLIVYKKKLRYIMIKYMCNLDSVITTVLIFSEMMLVQ